MEMPKDRCCAFTGHRPGKFSFCYDESDPLCKKIKAALLEQAERHYDMGVRGFWFGGALGVDMWAAEAVLALKEQYGDIQLYCAVPFKGYYRNWAEASITRLKKIVQRCDGIYVVSRIDVKKLAPASSAYYQRNQFMVDRCGCLIAVYDRERGMRSGTGMTVNYANSQKLKITYIHPGTAEVTVE